MICTGHPHAQEQHNRFDVDPSHAVQGGGQMHCLDIVIQVEPSTYEGSFSPGNVLQVLRGVAAGQPAWDKHCVGPSRLNLSGALWGSDAPAVDPFHTIK